MNHQTLEPTDHDAVQAALLKRGCPYPAGSTDAVIWLQGYKAGVTKSFAMAQATLAGRDQ